MSVVLKPKHAKGDHEPKQQVEHIDDTALGRGELAPNKAVVDRLYKEWQIQRVAKRGEGLGNFS